MFVLHISVSIMTLLSTIMSQLEHSALHYYHIKMSSKSPPLDPGQLSQKPRRDDVSVTPPSKWHRATGQPVTLQHLSQRKSLPGIDISQNP